MKIPILISHYTEHKASNKYLSFFGFLKMHYFNGDARDADYDRDMELPFKTNSNALLVSNSFSVPILSPTIIPIIPATDLQNNYSKYYSVWIPSGHLNDIFQPPRFS